MAIVIVTGSTGLLGRQVVKSFKLGGWKVISTGYTRAQLPETYKLDLNSKKDVQEFIINNKPQAVVHCAANRFPDKCENDPNGTLALNKIATSSLASVCAEYAIVLIYISTDYVFSGKPGESPYDTHCETNPPNFYGLTKLEGENALLSAFQTAGREGWGVILRVPVLYGYTESNKESAINVLMDSVWEAQEGEKEVQMDNWAIRYPTNTEDVARVCRDVAVKYLSVHLKSTLPSILHFSSEDRFTKYQICQLFSEIMGLPLDNLKPLTHTESQGASIQRPYDCHLCTRVLKDLGIDTSTQDFEGWWRREKRAYRK